MGVEAEWETHKQDIATLLKWGGFFSLSERVLSGEVMDYELRAALSVVLLHKRIPYLPLPAGAYSEIETCMNSMGVSHTLALKNKEVRAFSKSLPDDVQMCHIHLFGQNDFSFSHVIVVQMRAYGFILSEHFTLVKTN